MPDFEDSSAPYGPQFEVWNHLGSGLDLAEMELDRLEPESKKAIETFAEQIVSLRKSFALRPTVASWVKLLDQLLEDDWFRFAAEIKLAGEGVERASVALKRFMDLRPVFTDYRIGEKGAAYLREVISTFLFGFDAACIALSGAALEQVLREIVIEAGLYTEARLNRERPSGQTLLEEVKRAGRIGDAYEAAKRVFEQRNRVMHRHLWEDRIIQSIALETVKDLGRVLSAVGDRSE